MEAQSVLEKLDKKLGELKESYRQMQEENRSLNNEMITLKAQNENQRIKIEKLEEDLQQKELEAEEIVKKVEDILGNV